MLDLVRGTDAHTDREPQMLDLDQLGVAVAVKADLQPSVAAAAVQALDALVREGLAQKATIGVPGCGSIQPTTKGATDDGVAAVVTRVDPGGPTGLEWALERQLDLAPSHARRAVDGLIAALHEQLQERGPLQVDGLGVLELANEGPHNRNTAALLVRGDAPDVTYRCPVCDTDTRRFLPFAGAPTRLRRIAAQCAQCGALERHRMIWRYFEERTNLFEPPIKRMLHVAPEPEFGRRFTEHPFIDYLSIDLNMPTAMRHMDVTKLELEDESFDVVYCSHVLEHIPDDRKAMRELFRVLRPGGWGILQVPILREATEEDPAVVTREQRLERFGQADHVRAYGPDYRDRLVEAGFEVTVDDFAEGVDARYAVDRSEQVHYCTKPASTGTRSRPRPAPTATRTRRTRRRQG